jgi:hypothetical protein
MKINEKRVATKEFVGKPFFELVGTNLSYLNHSRS